MKMQIKLKRLMVVAVASFAFTFLQAQPDPGGDPGGNAPIDGGLSLLVAAGVGYAAKKRYEAKKKNEQHSEKDSTL